MNYWSQIPVVRIIIPFAIGIAFRANGGYFHESFILISFLLVGLYWLMDIKLKVFSKHKYTHYSGIVLGMALFFLGITICHSKVKILDKTHYSKSISEECKATIRISSDVHIKEKSVKFYGEVEAIQNDSIWTSTSGEVLIYIRKDSLSSSLKIGDKLILRKPPIELKGPQNPHEFDYRQYLHNHHIYYQYYIYPDEYLLIPNSSSFTPRAFFVSIRNWMLGKLQEYKVSGEEYAVISALVLGRKDDLDKDLFESYSSAGAMHVLAVSGLHVGLIYLVLVKLLLFLRRFKYGVYIKTFFILIGLWMYAGITGMSPSVMRAATMFTFIALGTAMKRHTNIYNTLASSALLLLVINPFLLMEVGFQLSYLAVLGIVYLQPKINSLIYSRFWIIEKTWEITSVSIAAQIATFPLGLLYFHQFPNYFLLSNLFVIPAATVILYTTFSFFLLSWFYPIGTLLANLLTSVVKLLNTAIYSMNSLPFNKIEGVSISTFESLAIYFFILMTIFVFVKKKMRYITLSLCSLLLIVCINTLESVEQNIQNEMVFHKVSGESAISISCGKTCHFISSAKLFDNSDRMQFHIENHLDYLGINNLVFHNIDSLENYSSNEILIQDGFIKVGNLKLLVLTDKYLKVSHRETMDLDILIVSNNILYNPKDIDDSIKYRCLLADGSNSGYCLDKLEEACQEMGIRFERLIEGAKVVPNFENITDGLHNPHKIPTSKDH